MLQLPTPSYPAELQPYQTLTYNKETFGQESRLKHQKAIKLRTSRVPSEEDLSLTLVAA